MSVKIKVPIASQIQRLVKVVRCMRTKDVGVLFKRRLFQQNVMTSHPEGPTMSGAKIQ